jgi:hypothetical protein
MKSWINIITALVFVLVAVLLVVALMEKRGLALFGHTAGKDGGAAEAQPDADVWARDVGTGPEPKPADLSESLAAAPSGTVENAQIAQGAASALPIEELRLPLEFYESGELKSQLTAAFADVPEVGDINATAVRFEMFDPDGATNLTVLVEDCRFSRVAGLATSDTQVSLRRKDIAISAKGLEWELTNEVIRLRSDVEVVLQRTLREHGGFLGGELRGD